MAEKIIYNKLVRDKIPEIIAQSGGQAKTRVLNMAEYRVELERKLDEEVAEFHKDQNPQELADIMEVVYALADAIGCNPEQLQQIYDQKHTDRGGFTQRIFLEETL